MTRLVLDTALQSGQVVHLGDQDAHYALRVRRMRPGDALEVQDAQGTRFAATLVSDSPPVAVAVGPSVGTAPAPLPIHLLCAVPKAAAFDETIRRISEIGVERLTPVLCARSVVHPKGGKVARWRAIAADSVKQCGRARPLRVDDPLPLAAALAGCSAAVRVMAHPAADGRWPAAAGRAVAVAVGPEGGFTESERMLLQEAGFTPVALGPFILRVETAAVVGAVRAAICAEPVR